ncbi:MAG: UbiD family decarboxylase [Pseudomonadota bacterium]|nr:UbiD family decarboxylase [Pseudomonadota bacterium]
MSAKRQYPDLHDHIEALRSADLLIEIDREINKDTEMHPLVRWQFRGGISDKERKAWLFTNVVDSKGRKFDIPVLVCGLAGSRQIYKTGMGCEIDEIGSTWINAMNNPVPPITLESNDAPCHEQVFIGEQLLDGHGLDSIPVPISTPGWDNAPYMSSSHFITKSPVDGSYNNGNYRAQLKAPDRLGFNPSIEHHTGGYLHWLEWKERGEPMPCAVVLGCPPIVSFTSVQKLPHGLDEHHVSGGLVNAPLHMVKAKTIDLIVPADAEVVVEGFISTEWLEPEAPFGESHGHVNLQEYNGFMDVTAITRKKNAVITSWVSQVTPSESATIKRPAYEAKLLGHLRDAVGIQGLVRVSTHEPLTSLHKLILIIMKKGAARTEVWRALYATAAHRMAEGKWVVAIDEDIDPDDANAIFWAMSYRCKPHRDTHMLPHKHEGHGPRSMIDSEDSAVLIDATLKEDLPPVALPKRQYMEKAAEIWNELGLPEIKPERPWYGYDLGEWNAELDIMARRAVRSDYWETGKIIAKYRRNDVEMNTEVRTLNIGNPGVGDEEPNEEIKWDGIPESNK